MKDLNQTQPSIPPSASSTTSEGSKSYLPKSVLTLIVASVVGLLGGSYYFLQIKGNEPSRTGPNCGFSPCPK